MCGGELVIAIRPIDDAFLLLLARFAQHFCRRSHGQDAFRYLLVFSHQRTRADDGIRADLCVRQHNCIHGDQHTIAHRRSVDDGSMPNGTLVAKREGCIHVYMQCTVVLDVRAAADDDGCAIARTTALYQMLAPSWMVTLPITIARHRYPL